MNRYKERVRTGVGFIYNFEENCCTWDTALDKYCDYNKAVGVYYGKNRSKCTGLKDIVGKDIYQGDVVIFSDVGGVFIHGCEVVWHDCSWCVSVLDERILPLPSDYGKEGIEVIGNKRENPDLLNKD